MMKEGNHSRRIIITILLGIAGILLFWVILAKAQSGLTGRFVQDEMRESSERILNQLTQNSLAGMSVRSWTDRNHQACLGLMRHMIGENPDLAESQAYLESMRDAMYPGSENTIQQPDLMIVDAAGRVLVSLENTFRDLKDEIHAPLLETFETGEMTKVTEFAGQTARASASAGTSETESDAGSEDVSYASRAEKVSSSRFYYALAVSDQRACVIAERGLLQMFSDMTDTWRYVLGNSMVGEDGFVFAWDASSDSILYYPDDSLLGEDVTALGLQVSQIHDGQFIRAKVSGEDLYLYPVYREEWDAWVACAVPAEELVRRRESTRMLQWLIFAIVAADAVFYAVLLLRPGKSTADTPGIREDAHAAGRRKKLIVFMLFAGILIFVCTFYLQTLYLMSRWVQKGSTQISIIEEQYKKNQILEDGFRQYYQTCQEKPVRMIAWYAEQDPEHVSSEELNQMEQIIKDSGLSGLCITDTEGNIVAASSLYVPKNTGESTAMTVSEEPSSSALPRGGLSAEPMSVSILLKTDDNTVAGYLNAEYSAVVSDLFRQQNDLGGILSTTQPGEGGTVFSVNQKTGVFSYYPDEGMIGKKVLDYGLRESDLKANQCKYVQLNRESWFTVTGQCGEEILFVAVLNGRLMRERLLLTIAGTLTALAILLLIGLPVWLTPPVEEAERRDIEWRIGHIQEGTAEKKVFRCLLLGIPLIAAWILLSRYFHWEDESTRMIGYVMRGNWEYGLNVFALTASLLFAFQAALYLFVFRWVVNLLSGMLSERTVTVIRMLVSLISYAGIFLVAYRSLVNFGMDPAVLLTSAGIVSVVIGIGANSMVGDIIAGILLLLEGDMQVGDVVRIGDFRGWVKELGIRKTKLISISQNSVKIIPNREIREVLHLSLYQSGVNLEYMIPYEADLEKAESLLMDELETMPDRIPELMGTPTYRGVCRLGDNGVVLRVKAFCHEANRHVVSNKINRMIYLMYSEHGIEVPYPQVTLHDAQD